MTAEHSAQPVQRLDKWLWHARLGRTRSAVAALVEGGKVRVNRAKVLKTGYGVKCGDVLTLTVGGRVRVLKVTGFADRRGPAAEAKGLYADLTPQGHEGEG